MPGYVVQVSSAADLRRYYLEAPNEDAARDAAMRLLGVEAGEVTVLRSMAKWEEDVFPPFPNELRPAP